MKRKGLTILAAMLVVLMAFTAFGCRRKSDDPKGGNGDKIIIGGAMSMTGIQAPLDSPAMEGIEVAIAELNEKGGIDGKLLEFRNMDSKSDSATASEVAKQLVDQGAVAIITSSAYDFGAPAARAEQEAGMVVSAQTLPHRCSAAPCWAICSLLFPCGTPPWELLLPKKRMWKTVCIRRM